MRARPIVPVAALAWSYAVIALVLRSFPAPRPSIDRLCAGAPPFEVLVALLREAGFKHMLVRDTTAVPSAEELAWVLKSPFADSAGGAVKGAVSDLLTCTRTRSPLAPTLITALGAAPLRGTFNPQDFTGPQGPTLITISAMGLAPDSSLAAVYWEYHCGALCAGGTVSFFTRTSTGGWTLWRSQWLWAS